ncbi:MAG: UbiA family prenyltransferase [Daejeonella sp.]|uniref:UbiA family prenyltransferase n=1 Tax=Daejeonella sp. JGW-45 TaxID=3034148 RepID=UPI0023EC39EC|nr:UbiA family prenyltransferase [Daejeonella sp. JGW-45]
MNKYLRQALDCLLFSNIFIALCAVAQGLVTYQLLGTEPEKHVLGLLFCSTLALYNFSILLARPNKPERSPFRRVRWIFSHYRLMITLTIISVLSILPLVFFLNTSSKILLVSLAIVSVAYSLPIFSIHDKHFGLRNIPGVKLFLIAAVWSLSCVLLPILELENSIEASVTLSDSIILIAKRFLFIAAITVPFDIRDLFQDKTSELKTIPVILGEKNALLICQGLLVIYVVLLFLFTRSIDGNFIGLMLTIVLSGWLIFKSKWKKDEYYYFFYLDGTMIVQFLMLLLCNQLPL